MLRPLLEEEEQENAGGGNHAVLNECDLLQGVEAALPVVFIETSGYHSTNDKSNNASECH